MDGLHFTVIVLWRHGQTPSLSRWRFDISAGDRCARNFLLYLRRLAQLRPLLDVVDQREQLPLPIDFVPTAQREAVEPLVVADVAEHRLDRRETSAIFFSTERAVDARTHVLRVRVAGPACQHGDLSRLGRVGSRRQTCIAPSPNLLLICILQRKIGAGFSTASLGAVSSGIATERSALNQPWPCRQSGVRH